MRKFTLRNNKTIESVVKIGLCTGCGTCVGSCPHSAIRITKNEGRGIFLPMVNPEDCNQCGICLDVCPGHSVDFKRLNLEIFGKGPKDIFIGNYISCYTGHATDYETRYNSASGGLVTTLLVFAIEEGIIDAALVTKMSERNPLKPEVFIARTKEEIVSAAKSKYCPVAANTCLREILRENGRFAVVGLPCHIQGIRKAEGVVKGLKERIVLHLGIFCIHCPPFLATEFLLQKMNIRKEEVYKIDYRGKGWPGETSIARKNGKIESIPYFKGWTILGSCFSVMRCTLCSDYACEFSDISFGDAWKLPEFAEDKVGKSVVISRNGVGEKLLRGAISKGKVDLTKIDAAKIIKSHRWSFRIKKDYLKARLSLFKLFNKEVPVYNAELSQPNVMGYLIGIFDYLAISLSSKRHFWVLLNILLLFRKSALCCNSKVKTFFAKLKSWNR